MVYWAAETSSRAGSSLSNYIGNVESGYQGNRAAVCRITCMGFEELHTRRAPSSMQTIRAKYLIVVVGSALMSVASLSLPGLAQDQVLKNCREEWRASQAALRANGDRKSVV